MITGSIIPNVSILESKLNELENNLKAEHNKISNKKKKDIEENFNHLIKELEKLKASALIQAKTLINIDLTAYFLLIQNIINLSGQVGADERLRSAIEESNLASFRVYEASVDLTIALLKDSAFDQSTKDDIQLLANTVKAVNAAIESPDVDNQALTKNIEAVQNHKSKRHRHAEKWQSLGVALIYLGILIAVAGAMAITIATGGTALPVYLVVIAGVAVVYSGMAMSFTGGKIHSYGERQEESGKSIQDKTGTLHTSLSTFARSKQSQNTDSTATNTNTTHKSKKQ